MAELVPYPFGLLVTRMFAELDREGSIFGLPQRKFFGGSATHDFGVDLHGRRAACPLGPAAGPHTQLAQNLVLGWLAGARVFELKTVQVLDDLTIPRPCIDMRTVGYNAEWSQELTVEESLEEYVKASMLIAILRGSGRIALAPGYGDTIFDMSVGYDLAGIRSAKLTTFFDGMRDARSTIARLRDSIPAGLAALRDLEFDPAISGTVTLSTFHGCPPDEIERIALYLMRERGLHCVVKLNPTLLGPAPLRHLLHDVLGYRDVHVPDTAFDRDTKWEQACGMVERLLRVAADTGTGFGVKFTNTLVVENRTRFLPDDQHEVYLSGAPLHVLAMHLVRQFRRTFGDAVPLSFSAGIDATNYPAAVALGLAPVTVCTDLLRPGGYARLAAYHAKLQEAMIAAGATTVDELVVHSADDAGSVAAARLANTEVYVERLQADERYASQRNSRPPARVERRLALFDCVTCDKCIPVCPNHANFAFSALDASIPRLTLRGTAGAPLFERGEPLALERPHQLATFADFCNQCGNCDVFCPEDGAPYAIKPVFFGSEAHWRAFGSRDGFFVTPDLVLARAGGGEYRLTRNGDRTRFTGAGFDVELQLDAPETTIRGSWNESVPLTWCFVMDLLQRSVLDTAHVNYVNLLWSDASHAAAAASGDDGRPQP